METPNVPKFSVKSEKHNVSRLGFSLLLYFIVYFVVQNISVLHVQTYLPELADNSLFFYAVLLIPAYLISVLILIFSLKKVNVEKISRQRIPFKRFLLFVAVAFTFIYVGSISGNFVGTIFDGIFHSDSYSVDNLIGDNSVLASLLFVCLLAPFIEELVFRKLLCDRLIRYGQSVAIITSGILFGLYHGNFYQFFYATLLGMLFSYIYVNTGSLFYSYTIHALINSVTGVLSMVINRKLDDTFYEILSKVSEQMITGNISEELINQFLSYTPAFLLQSIYSLVVVGGAIAGFVLLIVNRKKIKFAHGTIELGADTFSVVWQNLGIFLFIVFSAVLFALNFIVS